MINLKNNNVDSKPLSLGFLGVGWIGRNRMEVLINEGKIHAAAIFEPQLQNAQEALKIAEKAVIAKDISEIYNNTNLDGIVIATPSALHAPQSIKALKAGKAVFCQKPLGRTAAEVRAVVEASATEDKLLGVDLSYRYTKAFQEIYKIIRNGEIGEIFSVDLTFHNAYGPDKEWFYDMNRSGGGCVLDLGIHLIDLALWSLDFPQVKSVQSRLFYKGKRLEPNENQVEDYASVAMETKAGAIINLQCSWHLSAGRDAVIEAEFFGTEGGAKFKNINGSFYDFQAEKYKGTQTEILVTPPDDWSGRAGIAWAQKVEAGTGFEAGSAREFIRTAEIIDLIYKR